MIINTIQEDTVKDLKNLHDKIVIFGAGDLGTKVIYPLLKNSGIDVYAFWDNNPDKQGKYIDDVKIISYDELVKLGKINIVVGSNYIMQEMERVNKLDCNSLIQIAIPEPLLNEPMSVINEYVEGIRQNRKIFKDELSVKSIDCFLEYLEKRDVTVFQEVAVQNEHYLIKEVLQSLDEEDILVDLGAFIGEFPIELMNLSIPYKKCYCFEITDSNCKKLEENVRKYNIENIECVQAAACDKSGEIRITGSSANASITDSADGIPVKAVTLDEFFENEPFNYIKSDIEGAEMPALRGGQNVIKKYRPILAISIYHSISDYLNIPTFLNTLLEDYTFLIRNHSIFCAEIVLYAIPNERLKTGL